MTLIAPYLLIGLLIGLCFLLHTSRGTEEKWWMDWQAYLFLAGSAVLWPVLLLWMAA